jgi:tetratricopeptide (TPR) repeat protein
LERGFLFVELREWQAATDDFRRATEQNQRLIDAQNGLAWYQAEKLGTNLDESLAAAERALELAGPDPLLRAMVIDTVGWVHYKRSELEAAKQCVEEAVRLNDTSLYVRNHLAVLNSTVRAAV